MHAVHVRCDDEQPEHAIDAAGDAHVAVIEHGSGIENHLEEENRERGRAERDDHGELDEHGQNDFHGMETHAGRDVEIQIRMVHSMKTPKQRHRMEHDVLQVDGEVQHQHRERHQGPVRQRGAAQQPPAARLGDDRHAHRGGGKQHAQEQRIDDDDADVVRPARESRELQLAPGRSHLPEGHGNEHQEKTAEAKARVVAEDDVAHARRTCPRIGMIS